jgi:hypothetical protein
MLAMPQHIKSSSVTLRKCDGDGYSYGDNESNEGDNSGDVDDGVRRVTNAGHATAN